MISSIIIESLKSGSFTFSNFYSRRISRILPALIAVLFASLAVGLLVLTPDELRELGRHVAGSATFRSNFVLLRESGYFDNASETKVLLHLWSLAIEEQFYLLWPLALWAAWKVRFNALALILLLLTVSFVLNITAIKDDASKAFYLPQTRFWELLAGAALAYLNTRYSLIRADAGRNSGQLYGNLLSIGGLALLVYTLLSITKQDSFPGWWAVLPVAGTVMLIAAGPQALLNRHLLANRAMVWVGLISYPLYLWHWPLLTYARILNNGAPSVEILLAAVGLSLVLAWLTFRLIEKPLKQVKGRVKIISLMVLLIAVGLAGQHVYKKKGLPTRESVAYMQPINAQFVGWRWPYSQNETCNRRYPNAELADYKWWFCMQSRDAEPTLLLLGNSFANQLFPGIAHNAALQEQTVLSIGACDPAYPDVSADGLEKSHPCSGDRPLKQKQMIKDLIDKSGTVKYAIIDGLKHAPEPEYVARLEQYIGELEQRNVKVIVFLPHLELGYDPKTCVPAPYRVPVNDCSLDHEESLRIDANYARVMAAILASHPDTRFFDQKALMCKDGKCSAMKDGMPLFRDLGHLSEFGSEQLAKIFVEWARTNAPGLLGTP
ncbi:MAG TPA: acyltransferase [Pseudomonas sp.]|nr:acyltransferase [Pseudomonas sp.]